ncbi:cohesin domain-containing protein [Geotalea toluenoxydans]|uniref:cohesin domain-containing protein n=1 Tax=Geotalea toluenoxydans TaxID=421624 RepID=UPI0006D10F0B|nr:cohesin domain-containing protein [Geotalea toluenoxydans]
MKLFDSAVMFMLSLFFAASAFAAANVSMVPSDDGKSWTLKASDFENISGIDLTITYDPSILSNPNVTQAPLLPAQCWCLMLMSRELFVSGLLQPNP